MIAMGLNFRILGTIGVIGLCAMPTAANEQLDWGTEIQTISRRQGTQLLLGGEGFIDGPIPLLIALGVGGAVAAFAVFQQANQARNNLQNQANTLNTLVTTAETNINALMASVNMATTDNNSNLVRATISCAANVAAGALTTPTPTGPVMVKAQLTALFAAFMNLPCPA